MLGTKRKKARSFLENPHKKYFFMIISYLLYRQISSILYIVSVMVRALFSFCLFVFSIFCKEAFEEMKHHALYLMQQNKVEESLEKYCEYAAAKGKHDFETLRQIGFFLLEKGSQSTDNQEFMMSLLGAGLSGSSSALDVLERGIFHPDPKIQLISLHYLAKMEDDRIEEVLSRAMSSDFLAIRMEAALYMAERKSPHAIGQIEGLMYRLPPSFKPYFPSFFAILGTKDATLTLKRLIEDPDPQTRIETILHVARMKRDDFLPTLRRKLSHAHIAELEASAFAVGALSDMKSLKKLQKLIDSPTDFIRLAAGLSLIQLGDRNGVEKIFELARKQNLFAIFALGKVPQSEELLYSLLSSKDLQVRLNAALALLEKKDPRAKDVLLEILLDDPRELCFQPFLSVGRSLSAMKAISSSELKGKNQTPDPGYSLAFREKILKDTLHLPEESFLEITGRLFDHQQSDLIPTAAFLLETLGSEKALCFLEERAKKSSNPLIKGFCNLALFRSSKKPEFEEKVIQGIVAVENASLIQLQSPLPWKVRIHEKEFFLTPEEKSRLLIESFLCLASCKEEKNISLLLDVLLKGHPQNRFALIGLLMKATE